MAQFVTGITFAGFIVAVVVAFFTPNFEITSTGHIVGQMYGVAFWICVQIDESSKKGDK